MQLKIWGSIGYEDINWYLLGFALMWNVCEPGVLCNLGYPSATHLKLKSRAISFVNTFFISHPIILQVFKEHGCITAVLCTKFQNDWTTETGVMEERNFAGFEFEMSLGWISYICTTPPDHILKITLQDKYNRIHIGGCIYYYYELSPR